MGFNYIQPNIKTMKKNRTALFLICFLLQVSYANGGSPEGTGTDSIIIKKCQDFAVTGNGSSDQWNSTAWINLVQQGQTNSTYRTKVKVLYSGTGIYFLFDCDDKKLTSTMQGDNLNLWEEDVVEVFLWTSEDFPVYFEYELSPMNYELPIMVPNYKGTF